MCGMCSLPGIQAAACAHHDEGQQLLPLLWRGVRQRRHLEASAQHVLRYLDSGMLMPNARTLAQVQPDGPQLGAHSLMRCRSACA